MNSPVGMVVDTVVAAADVVDVTGREDKTSVVGTIRARRS